MAQAEAIVTFNLKDFPKSVFKKYHLHAIRPDTFIPELADLHISTVLDAVRAHRASLKNPLFSPDDYLDCLLRQQLPETVSRLLAEGKS